MASTRSIIYLPKKEDTKLKSSKFIYFNFSTLNILSTNKVTCCGEHIFKWQIRKLIFCEVVGNVFTQTISYSSASLFLCMKKSVLLPFQMLKHYLEHCTSPKPVSCLSCLPAGIASIAPAAVFMWNGWLCFVRGCLNFRVYESSMLSTSVGGTDVKLWSLVQLQLSA